MNTFVEKYMEGAKYYVEYGAYFVFALGIIVLCMLARDKIREYRG